MGMWVTLRYLQLWDLASTFDWRDLSPAIFDICKICSLTPQLSSLDWPLLLLLLKLLFTQVLSLVQRIPRNHMVRLVLWKCFPTYWVLVCFNILKTLVYLKSIKQVHHVYKLFQLLHFLLISWINCCSLLLSLCQCYLLFGWSLNIDSIPPRIRQSDHYSLWMISARPYRVLKTTTISCVSSIKDTLTLESLWSMSYNAVVIGWGLWESLRVHLLQVLFIFLPNLWSHLCLIRHLHRITRSSHLRPYTSIGYICILNLADPILIALSISAIHFNPCLLILVRNLHIQIRWLQLVARLLNLYIIDVGPRVNVLNVASGILPVVHLAQVLPQGHTLCFVAVGKFLFQLR